MPTEDQNLDRSSQGVPQGLLALALMPPLKILAPTLGVALLVWGLLFVYISSPAWAATITVNSTADPGADDAQCTLREAITSANTDTAFGGCVTGSGDDVIDIGGVTGTVDLTAALPDLSTNIEIVGPGKDQLTVTRPDTAERFRIFTVTGDTTVVTISGMTISNGNTLGLDDPRGGGISNVDNGTLTITDSIISDNTADDDGAIRNLGTLEVSNSTLSGNTSNGTAGGIYNDNGATATVSDSTFLGNSAPEGGGIFNSGGTLDVTNSTFSDNSSTSTHGGAFANGSSSTATVSDSTFSGNSAATEGGAIRNDGTLEVTNSTFSGNSAPNGGGMWHGSQTSLAVTDSTFSGNSATEGAGLFNRGGGTVTVDNSTFSGNRANLRGGGIFSDTNLSGETTTITNSTISANTAQSSGGGIYNTDGLTVIEFSTVTKNTAPNDQGSGVASVGNDRTSTEVLSSIISDNTNTDVDFVNDTTNTFVSRGYNLIGDGNATGAFNQTGDQTGVADPGLGALSNNGGPTQTHALLAGSPAIDKGNTDLTTDQRGEPRPFDDPTIAPATGGDNSDIGSFEAQSVLNSAPEATDDAYSTNEDTALSEAAPGVLDNDADPDSGDPLTAVLVDDVDNGTLTLNPDGSFTYEPDENFNGEDSFTYKANDGTADSNEATVSISVRAANDAPSVSVAQGGSCGSSSDMRGTINLVLSDPDDPPESLTLTVTSSNRSVLPNRNISFGGGTDASRTMIVSSLTGSGTSNVTITLSDGDLNGTVLVRVISGSAANNTLSGSANADMIFARKGSDTVSAQGANDLMCGGNGNDRLTGGLGADHFAGGSGTDTATDFNASQGDTRGGIP